MDALAKTGQAIRAKAYDISEHYRQHWQGTGFKAQLVAPSKAAAIRFKEMLDDIGHVTSEIIMSPPNDNEGNEEVDKESKDLVRKFWDQQMVQYKTEEEYNRQIIDAFKGSGDPEILIVVSKLLTGFDAPRNTVLYVCKSLKEHNLLQAIARVNRLFEEDGVEKQFGFIIDYEGLLGELDSALTTYSAFDGYDDGDLAGTVHDVREEIRRLPQLHDQLWDLFKSVRNKKDMEEFERFLADEAIRHDFYERLKAYGRCLHIAMSSDKFLDVFDEAKIDDDEARLEAVSELRRSVQLRYQEIVDIKEFEPKIQKLLDDHVVALPAETIIEVVNINDPEALKAVVEETGCRKARRPTASPAQRAAPSPRRWRKIRRFTASSRTCWRRPFAPTANGGCRSVNTWAAWLTWPARSLARTAVVRCRCD
jgi:type I restriction enzyme R subunit